MKERTFCRVRKLHVDSFLSEFVLYVRAYDKREVFVAECSTSTMLTFLLYLRQEINIRGYLMASGYLELI